MKLDHLFHPRSIAVVGVSRSRKKVGRSLYETILGSGYAGDVFAVNPSTARIGSTKCYPSVSAIPKSIDLAIIVVPAAFVESVIVDCGMKKVPFAIVISSGFKEQGKEGATYQERMVAAAKKHRVRIVGPNCLGMINTEVPVNASFGTGMPVRGGASFITQSGAMLVGLVDWARQRHIGLNKLISIGNTVDLDESDMLEYLMHDPKTSVVAMYLERVVNGDRLGKLIRRCTKKKPVVVLKVGRTSAAQRAISSHTGRLASASEAVEALVRQNGGLVVHDVDELFETIIAAGFGHISIPSALLVLTNAGGPAIVAIDAIKTGTLHMQTVLDAQQRNLRAILPSGAAVANPIDLLGDADLNRFARTLRTLERQTDPATVLILLTPQTVTPVMAIARLIERHARRSKHVIATCFVGGFAVDRARRFLREHQVLTYEYPADAVRYLALLRRQPVIRTVAQSRKSHRKIKRLPKVVTYAITQRIIRKAGLPIMPGTIVTSDRNIARIKRYPVVCKILSDLIMHKRATGGVVLGIQNRAELLRTVRKLLRHFPAYGREGILIQTQVMKGVEFIIGARRDPSLGVIHMVGLGGTFTEVIHDTALWVGTLDANVARHMVDSLRSIDVLRAIDRAFIARQLLRVQSIMEQYPDIGSIDINPLVVYERGGVIVDARFTR